MAIANVSLTPKTDAYASVPTLCWMAVQVAVELAVMETLFGGGFHPGKYAPISVAYACAWLFLVALISEL